MLFGCTVREAQLRLDREELKLWLSYRKRYGSLSLLHHSTYYLSLLSAITFNKDRDKQSQKSLKEFLPSGFFGGEESSSNGMPQTPDQVQAFAKAMQSAFSSSAKPGERRNRLFKMKSKGAKNGN